MTRHDAIEAELDRERRKLAARLDMLSGRLTAENLGDEAAGVATEIAASAISGAWAVGQRAAVKLATAAITPPATRSNRPHPSDRVPGLRRAEIRNTHPKGELPMTDTARKTGTLSETAEAVGAQAKASLESLRTRIDDGLDGLPEAARDRVRKARSAALAAQAEVEGRARDAAAAAKTTARENPLLVGVLAFAAGAAIAALLPRTSVENRTLGAQRDRLFDEAERIYKEERARLSSATSEAIEDSAKTLEDRMQTASPSRETEDASA